ncbi:MULTISPECIES: bifunctional helix-turn-helix transcriptional regulator/GNAT family N-acetyltransferase [Pacificimonas]|nr:MULTISPECIES: bifunctional helix-turn-helix transcriptional regulator/GNAT family N-acetyltransferase [Pacificimonas]MBZ6377281.1 bifunctional helix-turn-helix transcriptional regulator/GNAT family N-acetyltransferase [Pacificimonas aurantium]
MPDILADEGLYLMGSRLKRLAERMQADASEIFRQCGLDLQPPQAAALVTTDRLAPLSVGALAAALGYSQPAATRVALSLQKRGLVSIEPDAADKRTRLVSLTSEGEHLVRRLRREVVPRITHGVSSLLGGLSGTFVEQLAGIETAFAENSLAERALNEGPGAGADNIRITGYREEHAADFKRLNLEWLETMFEVEAGDLDVLDHPYERIIARGGQILFALDAADTCVGTCALKPDGSGSSVELTKMAVTGAVRGQKIGERLLNEALRRFEDSRFDELYLLTNTDCGPAIRLYEKSGFVHDDGVARRFASRYARANVAMRYVPGSSSA